MKKKLRSITRTVYNLAGFNIGVTVLFPRDKNPIKVYQSKGEESDTIDLSLYMDFPGFITITLPRNDLTKDIEFHRLKFSFGARWKKSFEIFLEEFIELFERDDIFYLEDGKLKMFMQLPPEATKIFKCGDSVIKLVPSIITDFGGSMYEGCRFILNFDGIEGELTYQELLGFKDVIESIDLFLYTQALLIYAKGIDNT